MRKTLRLFSVCFISLLIISLSSFTAFCAENHYYIKELKLNIDLPQEMLVATRESAETDKFFSVFGLNYENTMSEFQSANIYLEGMYEDSSRVFTVTMLSDDNSKSIGNYNTLNDDQLLEVEKSFLSEKEYSSCTIQRHNDYVFMDLQFTTETDGQTVYASQCNTVVDGKNITLTLQPAKGSTLTNEDYQIMSEILKSVVFSDRNTQGVVNIFEEPFFWYCVIGGVVLIALVIIIILVIKRRKNHHQVKRTEKKIKNQEIIQELAQEFSSRPSNLPKENADTTPAYEQHFSEDDYQGHLVDTYQEETAEEIIKQLRSSEFAKEIKKDRGVSNDYGEETAQEIYKRNESYDISDQELRATDVDINKVVIETPKEEVKGSVPLKTDSDTVLKIVTPDGETEAKENQEVIEEENVVDEKTAPTTTQEITDDEDVSEYIENPEINSDEDFEDYDEEYDEYDEDYDDELDQDYDDELDDEDEEVIGSDESFEQSEDYFDEALDEDVYSRDNIDDEDEYEKTRKPVINPEVAKIKAKTAGAVILNGILIFLNGVKSFFIHLGYFFANLARLIKRSYKKRKFKKQQEKKRRQAEEIRRRKQENAQRKQQRIRQQEENGLVKVRSSKSVAGAERKPSERRTRDRKNRR